MEWLDSMVISSMRSLSKWQSYPLFPWIVIWDVTRHCNLKCWYCNASPDNKSVENHWGALDSLLRLAPKGIYCFGGEPLFCRELPEILSKVIKNRPKTYISINTNGLFPDRLLECLPYLKQILYSIDGLDESNRLNRGCSGEVLFNNLKTLFKSIRDSGSPAKVVTHTVITRHNYRNLPELVAEVKKIDPDTPMLFFTLIPHSHPLSVRSDEKTREEFDRIFASLRKRYSGILINTEARHGIRIDCYRQYFLFFMGPNGDVRICKPDWHLDAARKRLQDGGSRLSFLERLRIYWHLVDILLLRKHAPACDASCDWHFSLEGYLRGEAMMNEGLLPVFQGNLTRHEAKCAYQFIRNNISRSFPLDWLTRFMDQSSEE